MIAVVQVRKWKKIRFREKLGLISGGILLREKKAKAPGVPIWFYMCVIKKSDGIS